MKWVAAQGERARVRPDMRIVVTGDFERLADRLDGHAEDHARDREDRGEISPSPIGRGVGGEGPPPVRERG